jgi:hypothetical protein
MAIDTHFFGRNTAKCNRDICKSAKQKREQTSTFTPAFGRSGNIQLVATLLQLASKLPAN